MEGISMNITTEEELARREALALNLADQLNRKIDECEALKAEVKTLQGYADALNERLRVESEDQKFELDRQKNIVRIMSGRIEESQDMEEEAELDGFARALNKRLGSETVD